MAEGGAGGWNMRGVLGFIKRLFLGWYVLFWDDIVDRLVHTRYFFIYRIYNGSGSSINRRGASEIRKIYKSPININ